MRAHSDHFARIGIALSGFVSLTALVLGGCPSSASSDTLLGGAGVAPTGSVVAAVDAGATSSAMDAGDATPPDYLEWGQPGAGNGQFNIPIGIAINAAGEVFVSDFRNGRIQRFTANGEFISAFGTLSYPGGIAVDPAGNVYVTHFPGFFDTDPVKPERVSVYDSTGGFVRQWGDTGDAGGMFNYPGGIAVHDGHVYVADQTNHRVQVFDTTGQLLFLWGQYGLDAGQFGGATSQISRVGGPQFVTLDPDGNVYTTEGSVGRVQKFTSSGTFLMSWGNNDDDAGSFGPKMPYAGAVGPMGIFADANGVWVTSMGGRVQQFTRDGVFMRAIGTGFGAGPMQFRVPHGIAVNAQGDVYVVDSLNNRVQKYAHGK